MIVTMSLVHRLYLDADGKAEESEKRAQKMTLGEAKRRTVNLINDFGIGDKISMDDTLNVRMSELFDIAQTDMVTWQPLIPLEKLPKITVATSDKYQFPLTEDAANCLPLFVAAIIAPDIADWRDSLYNLYLQMRGMVPREVYGGGGGH